jgi:putative ABC transport system ATP-binding protein
MLTDTTFETLQTTFQIAPKIAELPAEVIIDAKNITKIYGSGASQVFAADHVNFQVNQGEFVGLVGPSGSGKTTMLAILAALLKPKARC